MGVPLAHVSSGAQCVAMSLDVLKASGIHQGATRLSPASPGSPAAPQPSSPSIVKGFCSAAPQP